ncbi:MAG: PAS domain S-box protein [Nitrospirota bacterium]|nr:PAS domain S-box protein [Nitrospirota bacterium]
MKAFRHDSTRISLPRIKRCIVAAAALWTIFIVSTLAWYAAHTKKESLAAARHQAATTFERDVLYSRWNAGHGGVYVPVSPATGPNPRLSGTPERDIVTPSGRKLTLLNPAYMTRQIHELQRQGKGVLGHITSLKPIRPGNAPDPWETEALRAFERGEPERTAITELNSKKYYRLIRPLITEKACLKCHARQGYREGEVRGGISVSIPMAPFTAFEREHVGIFALLLALFWLAGLGILGFSAKKLIRMEQQRRHEETRLQRLTETLLDFGPDPLVNINRLTGLCGELLGAACALYNRLEAGMLCSRGTWQAPQDYVPMDKPDGHICYDVIRQAGDEPLVVRHLPATPYFRSDPNVSKYGLETYMGRAVVIADKGIGSLCVVYQKDYAPDQPDRTLLSIIAAAIGTEERRFAADKSLRESEDKFRVLADKSPNMIFINKQGRIVYANEQCVKIMGYRLDEYYAPGFDFKVLIAPEYHPIIDDAFRKHMAGEDIPAYEIALVTKTGKRVEVIQMHTVINYENAPAVLGIITDITDRKLAELQVQAMYEELERKVVERTSELTGALSALKTSESKLMAIFNAAADGIALIDGATMKIVDANEMFCRMLGYRREELLGFELAKIHTEEHMPVIAESLSKVANETLHAGTDVLFKRKDGTILPMDVNGGPIVLEDRTYLLGIFRDTTEHRKIKEELARKEKLATLGQLAGTVGHELRNPLAVIKNAAYYLKTVLPSPAETVREYLEIIASEVDGSERILAELLDFARTTPPRKNRVAAGSLLRQSLDKCAVPGNIALRAEIPESLPEVDVDLFQMTQVFRNLVVNAVQAMPKGGELRVSARLKRDERRESSDEKALLEITVADTGEGITPENMEKLFQPLFTTKMRGIGLGLTLCKKLTESNGGTIAVKSSAGQGAAFTVTVPAA